MEKINSLQLFDIDTVPDSSIAIEHLKRKKYQFIISEINAGKVDGWSLSSLIRSDIYKSDKKVPIVLLTDTHCERIAEATAKSFGINAVVTKSELNEVNTIFNSITNFSSFLTSSKSSLDFDLGFQLN